MQSGGWSLTWQGDKTKTSDYPNADTLLSALRKTLGPARSTTAPTARASMSASYSAVVMVAAEKPYAEGAGDITFPSIDASHQPLSRGSRRRSKRVSGKGVPVVTLLYSGRPGRARTISSIAPTPSSRPGCREPKGWALPTCCLPRPTAAPRFDFTGRLPFDWPAGDCLPKKAGSSSAAATACRSPAGRRLGRLPESAPVMACPAESR